MTALNNWTIEKEKKIINIKESCEVYVNAHDEKREKYRRQLNISTGLKIIISMIITILGSFASYPQTTNFWIIITATILSAISTGGEIFISFLNPAAKLSNHTDIRNKYNLIIYKINQELFFEIKNRNDCNEFMREICKEMLELETGEDSLPIINKNIFTKEKEKINKKSSEKVKCTNIQNIELGENNDNDIENGDDNCSEESDVINGLTINENRDFHLLFKKMPSIDTNLMKYQMERFNG